MGNADGKLTIAGADAVTLLVAGATNYRGGDPVYGPGNAVDGDLDTYWAADDGVTEAVLEVVFDEPTTFNRSCVQEHIALGQRVEAYAIEAWTGTEWKKVVHGTTIGHKKLDRFDDVAAERVRLVIEKAKACPTISAFGLYCAEE